MQRRRKITRDGNKVSPFHRPAPNYEAGSQCCWISLAKYKGGTVSSRETALFHNIGNVWFTPDGDQRPDIAPCPKSAMCGRLRVGKNFLHVCSIGRCSHVFGL